MYVGVRTEDRALRWSKLCEKVRLIDTSLQLQDMIVFTQGHSASGWKRFHHTHREVLQPAADQLREHLAAQHASAVGAKSFRFIGSRAYQVLEKLPFGKNQYSSYTPEELEHLVGIPLFRA